MRSCDATLMAEAPYSMMGNVVSWWVWNGNKNPDTAITTPRVLASVANRNLSILNMSIL